jgi:predicted CoA-binding protein
MAQGPESTDGSSIPEAVQKTNGAAVDPVTEILKTSRTVAVVGLSN